MSITEKNKGGRPSKYKPAFNQQAYKLCLLGATDKELADFFEVNEDTINTWKKAYPKFSESLKRGKVMADSIVAEKLFHRATGYSHPDSQVFIYYGKPIVVKTVKHFPPDTVAAIFWLKNRAKATWRDKQDIGLDFERMTEEQLDKAIEAVKKSVNE